MMWSKLKGGALQLTLFIIVLIAILMSSFVLFVHTHKQFAIQTNFIIETTKLVDKGFEYALFSDLVLNDTTIVDSKNEEHESLKVHRAFWGSFELVTSISKIKTNEIKKIGFVGGTQPEKNRIGLYVQDNDTPLFISGDSRVEGIAYIPSRGVKPGIIPNQPYINSELIYGKTRVSNKLPQLFSEMTKNLKNIERNYLDFDQEQMIFLESGKSYGNSFLKPTKHVYYNTDVNLESIKAVGNIIIQSKTKIIVKSTSSLKDVILIAPEIEIQKGVEGVFQAIASEKIIVKKNVKLDYPSALILFENENSGNTESNNILIESSSIIKGQVVYLGQPKSTNYDLQLQIKENTSIIGEVYCSGNLELKGNIYGSVYTNNFVSREFSSNYQNHIHNATINVTQLPQEYVGLVFKNSKKGIMKWLY